MATNAELRATFPAAVQAYLRQCDATRDNGRNRPNPSPEVLGFMLDNNKLLPREGSDDEEELLQEEYAPLRKKEATVTGEVTSKPRSPRNRRIADESGSKQAPTPIPPRRHTAQEVEAAQGLVKMSNGGQQQVSNVQMAPHPYDWMRLEQYNKSACVIQLYKNLSPPKRPTLVKSASKAKKQATARQSQITVSRSLATDDRAQPAPYTDGVSYPREPLQAGNLNHWLTGMMDYDLIKQAKINVGTWQGYMIPGGNFSAKAEATIDRATGDKEDEAGPVSTKRAPQKTRKNCAQDTPRRTMPDRKNKRKAQEELEDVEKQNFSSEPQNGVALTDAKGNVDMDVEEEGVEPASQHRTWRGRDKRLRQSSGQSLLEEISRFSLSPVKQAPQPPVEVSCLPSLSPMKPASRKVGRSKHSAIPLALAPTAMPVVDEPVADEPIADEAVAEGPAMKEPASKEPAAQKLVTKRPLTKKGDAKEPEDAKYDEVNAGLAPAMKKASSRKMKDPNDPDKYGGTWIASIAGPKATDLKLHKSLVAKNNSSRPEDKVWKCIQYPKPWAEAKAGLDLNDVDAVTEYLTLRFALKVNATTTKTIIYTAPDWNNQKQITDMFKKMGQKNRRDCGTFKEIRMPWTTEAKSWLAKWFTDHPKKQGDDAMSMDDWQELADEHNPLFKDKLVEVKSKKQKLPTGERTAHGIMGICGRDEQIKAARKASDKVAKAEAVNGGVENEQEDEQEELEVAAADNDSGTGLNVRCFKSKKCRGRPRDAQ